MKPGRPLNEILCALHPQYDFSLFPWCFGMKVDRTRFAAQRIIAPSGSWVNVYRWTVRCALLKKCLEGQP